MNEIKPSLNFAQKIRLLPNAAKGYLFCDPLRNGEYKFLKASLQNMGSWPVVFDIGANIGQYARLIKSIRHDSVVHCFEPSPESYQQLAASFGSDTSVILNEVALSETAGSSDFFIYGEVNQMNSLERHSEAVDGDLVVQKVVTMTVDQYCMRHGIEYIDFMKIDVEGHEVKVLQGASQMLNRGGVGIIQFEYNSLWRNTIHTLKDALALLENYHFYRLTPWGRIPIRRYSSTLEVYPAASNYIAILRTK